MCVLQLHPAPPAMRRPSGEALADGDASSAVMPRAHPEGSAPLVYTLKRGRTAAVVEGMEWAHGKAWLGMSTRRRTIHAFAVTHSVTSLTGAVISRTRPGTPPPFITRVPCLCGALIASKASSTTELAPIVRGRLRSAQGDATASSAPCAFACVRPPGAVLPAPASLLPPQPCISL